MPTAGTAVVNNDDKYLSSWSKKSRHEFITYAIESEADVKAGNLSYNSKGCGKFDVEGISCAIKIPGRHNVYNALAAIAASLKVGCDLRLVVDAIGDLQPPNMRSEIFISGGVTFINDCYNANPESMKRAIDLVASNKSPKRKIAVLGDMFELGENAAKYHKHIGEYLNFRKINGLYSIGKLASGYFENFKGEFKKHFEDKGLLIDKLKNDLKPGDIVLIKGSRGMALEEITEAFRGDQ